MSSAQGLERRAVPLAVDGPSGWSVSERLHVGPSRACEMLVVSGHLQFIGDTSGVERRAASTSAGIDAWNDRQSHELAGVRGGLDALMERSTRRAGGIASV